MFKSTDAGASWHQINVGLPGAGVSQRIGVEVEALVIDPLAPETLYIGTMSDGVFKSTDGGEHWTVPGNWPGQAGYVLSIAVDPGISGLVYVGTFGDGFWRTRDGGATWGQVYLGNRFDPQQSVYAIAIDPTNSATLYVAGWGQGVFKSTDGGAGWAPMNDGLGSPYIVILTIDPTAPGTLYAGAAEVGSVGILGIYRIDQAPRPAGPAAGIQITPHRGLRLVSKDVGGERWAITLDPTTGGATGSIFYPDGRDPKFVACDRRGDDGNPDPGARIITFSCRGADRCVAPSCPGPGDWTLIGDSVEIPGSFFLPRGAAPGGSASDRENSPAAAMKPAADAPSGFQITPDRKWILVSKPVGAERWAISRSPDDLSVTGNVFFADGREPKFLSCTQVADDENPDPDRRVLSFDCFVASRCLAAACPGPADWQPIGSRVELPLSFFLPR